MRHIHTSPQARQADLGQTGLQPLPQWLPQPGTHLLGLLLSLAAGLGVVQRPVPLILAGGWARLGRGHGAAGGTCAALALGGLGRPHSRAGSGESAIPLAVSVHAQVQGPIFIHLNVHSLRSHRGCLCYVMLVILPLPVRAFWGTESALQKAQKCAPWEGKEAK